MKCTDGSTKEGLTGSTTELNGVYWLEYYAKAKVIICHAHGIALSSPVSKHLSRYHRHLPLQERQAIARYYDQSAAIVVSPPCDGYFPRHFSHGPKNPRPPVPGLTIRNGYACGDHDNCQYLTTSYKMLKTHCNKQHAWKISRASPIRWSAVSLQTFFTTPGTAVYYFCVETPAGKTAGNRQLLAPAPSAVTADKVKAKPKDRLEEEEAADQSGDGEDDDDEDGGDDGENDEYKDSDPEANDTGDPLDHKAIMDNIKSMWRYDEQKQEEAQRLIAKEATLRHETTNWLKRTGWSQHFGGRDIVAIAALARMPRPEEQDLCRLTAAINTLFFKRCVDGLANMPLMTRLLLASPHPSDAHSRPFGPLQEQASMLRYLGYWQRFICYCMNVLELDEAELLEKHGFSFAPGQQQALDELEDCLNDDFATDDTLQDKVLAVSAAFWMQRITGDPFESPLWHFVAVLAIDADLVQLRPAHNFTYVLAGLVYVGRALLAEWAIPTRERATMRDLETRFNDVRRNWLCTATYSPMGYILSLLLYGRKIASETGSRVTVSWSENGKTMYFKGRPIIMDGIRDMVARLTADAEDLLWDSLMFKGEGKGEGKGKGKVKSAQGTAGHRVAIPLSLIRDDLTQTQRGRSFIHLNGLAGRQDEMLEDLMASNRRPEFLDAQGHWREGAITRYMRLVTQFEAHLLALAHMTGGQPPRGEEILGLRLVNGINRDRNVFVIDGEVVLVTQYHKSQAHFDSPRVVPRFLPSRVGQLMALYMVYIRPLTDRWLAEKQSLVGDVAPPSDFVWRRNDGTAWPSHQLSLALSKRTEQYMGARVTLQDWRHVAIAISRRHAREQGRAKADFDYDGDSDDDADNYQAPDDLGAAHTSKTAEHYGVSIDVLRRLTAESLEVFRRVSHRWHKFLGCRDRAPGPSPPGAKKDADVREVTGQDEEDAVGTVGAAEGRRGELAKRPRRSSTLDSTNREATLKPAAKKKTTTRPGAVDHTGDFDDDDGSGGGDDASNLTLLRQGLRQVLRDETADFRSPQQEEAMLALAAGKTPLVVVLPTGGGKSLLFMVPATLPDAGVTVVVAPFTALKAQLAQRCADAGLDCAVWPDAARAWPRLVVVSANAASSDTFLTWAADLRTKGRLDRVVIDECHLTFTAADEYRPELRGLVLLRTLACPIVCLTGTLPPLRQHELETALLIERPLYIRSSTHRLRARYAVHKVRSGHGFREVVRLANAHLASDDVTAPVTPDGKKARGIIFCLSHGKCKAAAAMMKCHYFHTMGQQATESAEIARRDAGFQSWVRGESKSPYIVATAALGTGLDVAGVTHIIHLDAPRTLIDHAQETGRGGRAGEAFAADVVVEEKDWPAPAGAGDGDGDRFSNPEKRFVDQFIGTTGCRRRALGQYMDGDSRDCKGLVGATLCDNCERPASAPWESEAPSRGITLHQQQTRRAADGMMVMEEALEEIRVLAEDLGDRSGPACRPCWLFEGRDGARHAWYTCDEFDDELTFKASMDFQGLINYRKDPRAKFLSCFFCHVSQKICTDGYSSKGQSCRYKHTVLPLCLAATTDPELWRLIQASLVGRDFRGRSDYVDWLGRKHPKLVCGQEMTNAMAVFRLLIDWRGRAGEEGRGPRHGTSTS